MGVIRYVYGILLAGWLGAILFFGAIVAPALFHVLAPLQAGAVVARVLSRLDAFGLAASGMLLLVSLLSGQPGVRGVRARSALLAAMALCVTVSLFWVTPRMESLRREAPAGISELAPNNPLRQRFGRLHGLSSSLMLAELLLGLVAWAFPLRRQRPVLEVRNRGGVTAAPPEREPRDHARELHSRAVTRPNTPQAS